MTEKKLKVTLVKSVIRQKKKTKATALALGLRKLNITKEFNDTPQVRGMLFIVKHMVRVEEI
ncbi:TPA: 50S ribosomal protein L30 [Candidatus Delongbacteria bacterium]|nr:MAG: 50S ribosomal protein L30 [Candidatus Delongbacteria bacterium GWF2_40_14]HAQ61147.1 50S ribosomal protein L30 [Candidatus Delongbacteria bacterium]